MIESRLNELNLRRWRAFKSEKRSVFALIVVLVVCFFSFTAELWANGQQFPCWGQIQAVPTPPDHALHDEFGGPEWTCG